MLAETGGAGEAGGGAEGFAGLRRENEALRREVESLRAQLDEAQETLRAIREGEVDALIVSGPQGDRIYTLESAEQAYRVLVEQMREGAATLAGDGAIQYANRALADILRRPLQQVFGSSARDHVAESDRSLFDGMLRECQGGGAHGEVSLLAADGTLVPVYLGLSRLVAGGVSSICMAVTDLSQQKRTEEVLAGERYMRAILNQAADAITVFDAQGRLTFANAAARKLAKCDPTDTDLGLGPAGWGKRYDSQGRPVPPEEQALVRALAGESTVGREIHMVPADGTAYDALINAAPLRDADGTIIGAVCGCTDITALKEYERQLQSQADGLKEAVARLNVTSDELRASNDSLVEANERLAVQRHQYEDLFESAPDGYTVTDTRGAILQANRAACAMLRVEPKYLVGQRLDIYLHTEDQREFPRWLAEVQNGVSLQPWEVRLRPCGGEVIETGLSCAVERDPDGQPVSIRWILRDITARKRMERSLFETQQRLTALMGAVPVGVSFSDDTTCERITGNPTVLAQFEITAADNLSATAPDEKAPGRQVRFLKDGQPVRGADLPLQRAVAEDRVIEPMEMEVVLPSGRRWFAEISGAPIRDADGRVIGGVAVTVDITARKEGELRLAEQARELARSNAELSQFASIISHDLRAPLTSVSGCADMLEGHKSRLPEEDHEYITWIKAGIKDMTRLIDSLLYYSRVGRSELKRVECRLNDVVADVIRTLRAELDGQGAEVTMDALPTVAGDQTLLAQLFQNLIGNAIKYHSEPRPHVHISARRDVGAWVVSVADNGIGIPQDQLDKVFQIFHRVHKDESQYPGLGVGLATCKKIVEKHGGRIWVESQPGQGSTFFFSLRG